MSSTESAASFKLPVFFKHFLKPIPIEILLEVFSGNTPKLIVNISILLWVEYMLDMINPDPLLFGTQWMVFDLFIHGKAFIADMRIAQYSLLGKF